MLFASVEDYAGNHRFWRATFRWLALVFGVAALLLTILMIVNIILSAAYRNLIFIGGVALFLMLFGVMIRFIFDDPWR